MRADSFITITEADLKRFAPKAKREYVTAIIGGLYQMRAAGILDNEFRLAHFMAQCGHETDGFTIVRESLYFKTAQALRNAWPSRFRSKSDTELAGLLKNEKALGDEVYGGRMGNSAPGDGYAYRGGGCLQSTGKEAVVAYAKTLGVDPSPSLLDDIPTTFSFACIEWQQAKCSEYADENDLTKVSKAINTGSATSNVKPVGMQGRQEWFAKAWATWGHEGEADVPARTFSLMDGLKVAGGAGAVATTATQIIPPVPPAMIDAVSNIQSWKAFALKASTLPAEMLAVGSGGAVSLLVLVALKRILKV